jgi:hypothetical protein
MVNSTDMGGEQLVEMTVKGYEKYKRLIEQSTNNGNYARDCGRGEQLS